MPRSAEVADRTNRVQVAARATLGLALLVAAGLGTYQASLAKARAVRDVVPEGAPSAEQYLPGAAAQIGTLRQPLMAERRSALRAGFEGEDAPIDAFDRLRSVPGHEDEARRLLAQFWDRKAALSDDPLSRALYALQARVVDDADSRRRTGESALAALGPLRRARHVAEGSIVSCDPESLVLRGSGWWHVASEDAGTSFDLPESGGGSALVGTHRMVTWGDETARVWDVDTAATVPIASLTLTTGETPVAFSDGCVLTSRGQVWRVGDGSDRVGRGPWLTGSINPACDHVVLRGPGLAAYRRHGKAWTGGSVKVPGAGARVHVCASQAPRCVVTDGAQASSVWAFGAAVPRRLLDSVECEPKGFSPDGRRLMCRESQGRVTTYGEDDAGAWTRTGVMLPALSSSLLRDDDTICGIAASEAPTTIDRSDLLFFEAKPCWAPPAVAGNRGKIRMLPAGTGAIFTDPPTGRGASGGTEFFGFEAKGESLADASNAWFGDRTDERLLEHDTTNSAGEKTYDLAGVPFDPAGMFAERGSSPVQIEQAFFVESPETSLILEVSYEAGSPATRSSAVARWSVRGEHFCGSPIAGRITSIAPTGDAVAIDGRIYEVGLCASDHGFEPGRETDVLAVGPGATRWISAEGDTLKLHGPESAVTDVPSAAKGSERRVAFSPNGGQFLVQTARSLCHWVLRDDGTLDLDGCRWSTGGWASDAAWAATDRSGGTVVVFDRTADGAVLREFFGDHEAEVPPSSAGDLACNASLQSGASPLASLEQWEERLGHRFKDQAASAKDAREMASSTMVSVDAR